MNRKKHTRDSHPISRIGRNAAGRAKANCGCQSHEDSSHEELFSLIKIKNKKILRTTTNVSTFAQLALTILKNIETTK